MFTCKRTDERDAGGNLVATGVEWTERKLWFDGVMMLVVFIGLIMTMFAVIATSLMTIRAGEPWWIPATIAAVCFSPVFWSNYVEIEGSPRQLLFHRDGRVTAPNGVPFFRRVRTFNSVHADFASIEVCQVLSNAEAQQTAYSQGVVIIMRNGEKAYVATKLHADEAFKVAVQLTQALAALRDDVASGAAGGRGRQKPAAKSRPKPMAPAWID